MSDLLFAFPWWLFISLCVMGGVIFWSGNNRGQKGPRVVGIAIILLAAGLKTLSYFVETDKEKVEKQSLALVNAVQKRDWTTFESFLDPDVRLGTSVGSIFPNEKALVEGARSACERNNLTNVSARVTNVEQDNAGITVDLDAWSDQDVVGGYNTKLPSSWKLIWDRSGNDWRLHEVTCLRIGNSKPEAIGQLIGR
jgi:hypothetical protein